MRWVGCVLAAGVVSAALAAAETPPEAAESVLSTEQTPPEEARSHASRSSPISGGYVPPRPEKRIAGGRVGGGTRAESLCGVRVTAVAPVDHVGLTLESRPTLYFVLSNATACAVEFVLNDRRQVPPLVEAPLKREAVEGLNAIVLSEYGVSLDPEVDYDWFVQIKRTPDAPTPAAYAGAQIRRIVGTEGSSPVDTATERAGSPARASVFYDAFAALSAAADSEAGDGAAIREREDFLESIGLERDSSASAR